VRFRDRLLATLRAVQPILDVRGVLVAGSEVPNLLEVDAASTLVVSQDVVVAGLLAAMTASELDELERGYLGLPLELRHQVRSNLAILSLLDARHGMPDPRPQRVAVDALMHRLEPP
jgi:hypothetical protein